MLERLSSAEREFLFSFASARRKHLDTTVLSHMPSGERLGVSATFGVDSNGSPTTNSSSSSIVDGIEASIRDGPLLSTHVFVRVLQDIPIVSWSRDPIAAGNGYILAYEAVRENILAGDVELR